MTTRRRADDDQPVTLGALRRAVAEINAQQEEHYVGGDVYAVELAVRDIRQRLDALIDFMLEVYDDSPAGGRRGEDPEDRIDRYARVYNEKRQPDGTRPTQEELAEAMGVTDRYVRIVGWPAIEERADDLAEGGSPE